MKSKQLLTLVWVTNNDKVLLGMKKRGHGLGFWNGFGGKVEVGETLEECVQRELEEESELKSKNFKKIGVLTFDFAEISYLMEVHVFSCDQYSGSPTETEEMRPQWFSIQEIPYDRMWTDVKIWFPLFIKGSKFSGHFRIVDKSVEKYVLNEIIGDSAIEPIDSID